MDKVIKDFEVEDQKEEIKKWYDGYIIGKQKNIQSMEYIKLFKKKRINAILGKHKLK